MFSCSFMQPSSRGRALAAMTMVIKFLPVRARTDESVRLADRTGVSRLHRNSRRQFEFADPNADNFAECELRHLVFNDASSRAGRIFSANASKRGSPWSGLSNGSKRIVFMSGWRLAKDFSKQSIARFLSPSPR